MQYKETILKNGLRIVTVPMEETQTATAVIMVGVGSRYEKENEAGLSHFIEHMLFKGTKKRPTPLIISEALDVIGGEFNAFTGKDRTGYYAKADAQYIETVLDVVSDMYLNSTIKKAEIEKEKGTILQELNMYEDMPMRSISDIFEKLLYQKNSLGREVIGYKKTIRNFQRKDFLTYKKQFYVANNTVVCVAGKINTNKRIQQVKKYFSSLKKETKQTIDRVEEKQKKPQIKIKFKKTEQTHLMLGVRAYDWNDKNRYALALLAIILGGNMSSRLFMAVRERLGLAYYIKTGVEAFEDGGYLVTSAGVKHQNLKLTVQTILKEYSKIRQRKISEKELNKAKNFLKGKAVMSMEASDEVAMFFVEQEVTKKKIVTLKDKLKLIDQVTTGDVLKVAQDIFQEAKLNLAIIGPHRDGQKIKKLLVL